MKQILKNIHLELLIQFNQYLYHYNDPYKYIHSIILPYVNRQSIVQLENKRITFILF